MQRAVVTSETHTNALSKWGEEKENTSPMGQAQETEPTVGIQVGAELSVALRPPFL